jgi:hypothetical protein
MGFEDTLYEGIEGREMVIRECTPKSGGKGKEKRDK